MIKKLADDQKDKKGRPQVSITLTLNEAQGIVGGFKQDWISGTTPEGKPFDLLCGAGLAFLFSQYRYGN